MSDATIEAGADWRPAGTLALALAIVALGWHMPLPALDSRTLDLQFGSSASSASLFSVLALGVQPLFTACALAEGARLLLPASVRRAEATRGGARWTRTLTCLLALGFVLLQGNAVLVGLEAVGAPGDDAMVVRLARMASFVGGLAVVIVLAERDKSLGIWLPFAAVAIATIPYDVGNWLEATRREVIPAQGAMGSALYAGAVVAATVFGCLALAAFSRPSDAASDGMSLACLLWPPFLAAYAAASIVAPLAVAVSSLGADAAMLAWLRPLLLALFIPLVLWRYAVVSRVDASSPDRDHAVRPIFLFIGFLQIAACVGQEWLWQSVSLPLGPTGGSLIVVVAVLVSIGRSAALPAFLARHLEGNGRPPAN